MYVILTVFFYTLVFIRYSMTVSCILIPYQSRQSPIGQARKFRMKKHGSLRLLFPVVFEDRKCGIFSLIPWDVLESD